MGAKLLASIAFEADNLHEPPYLPLVGSGGCLGLELTERAIISRADGMVESITGSR
jgi:hypothetical protein